MSLISSINLTFSGIRSTESNISTVSANVSNADKDGYTTKTYQTSYLTTQGVTTPVGGITVGSLSASLNASTISAYSDYSYDSTVSDYLDQYSSLSGSTDGSTSLSAMVDDLETAISSLSASPEDDSQKTAVVDAAEGLSDTLNSLSNSLQQYRTQIEQDVSTSVDTINSTLQTLQDLNTQIATLQAEGQSTADLEDDRMTALTTLSQQMDVNYYFTSDNKLQIYTTGGQPLLDTQAHTLSYDAASNVAADTVFSGIMLNGQDITSSIDSGNLGGLLDLRDNYFVQEQDKLDTLADTLASSTNAVLNAGTSYPARADMTGDTTGLSATDSFSATGTLRVATVDQSGYVTNTTDIDLSAYTTIGDLVSALDALPGISASLTADGQLELTADSSSDGISLNQMDSAVGADSDNFSSYFGLNNLFSGTDAGTISVSSYLQDNPDYLATATLSDDSALAVGDRGISSGDASVVTALSDTLTGKTSFAATGNFSAQTTTFSSYAAKIVSDIATRASNADTNATTSETLYNQAKSTLDNQQGVNVDEEMARLTALESQYQSSATLIATIKDMFDSLIQAVS